VASKRAQRIKDEISILSVLIDYGYQVHPEGGDREQQFQCDLHGDGHDGKPSARVYPASASFFCFACAKTYDAISLVQIKEGIGYSAACRRLERKYNLPVWANREIEELPQEIRSFGVVPISFVEDQHRVDRLLTNFTNEKSLSMQDTLAFWEAFDKIVWLVSEGGWPETTGQAALQKLRLRAMEKEKEVLWKG